MKLYNVAMVRLSIIVLFVATLFSSVTSSHATTEYARRTGFKCGDCHVESIGGGPLTRKGQDYLDELKIKGVYRPLSRTQRIVRFCIGYIHLLTAIAWFGTILYVHILLKPAYAAGGLPKGELFLGWFSIIILSITGVLLTIARIPVWKVLFTTRFGILLSIKVFLFLMMILTAVIVTFFIGPRLKKKLRARWEGDIVKGKQDLTVEELHGFDGSEGRPAFIGYKGKVYDVTASRLWKDGSHVKKHSAGHDLTDALRMAPHGDDKLASMHEVGRLMDPGTKAPRPLPERVFYALAYINLCFVFLITFVIALWRWW